MAKRKRGWTEEKISKYIKEGRGQGEGESYKPWLTIQDVPSRGRVTRIKGWKTNRIHHLFSDLERNYFFLLEWADKVVDINEQFALDLNETMAIAESLGIEHPKDPITNIPIVMTTDFSIRLADNQRLTRTTKHSNELADPRVIEKFEIERNFWAQKGINWGIVTEKEIDAELVRNINWIHSSYELEYKDSFILEQLMIIQERLIQQRNGILQSFALKMDQEFNLEEGTTLSLIKHLIARKLIKVDMYKRLSVKSRLEDVSIDSISYQRSPSVS